MTIYTTRLNILILVYVTLTLNQGHRGFRKQKKKKKKKKKLRRFEWIWMELMGLMLKFADVMNVMLVLSRQIYIQLRESKFGGFFKLRITLACIRTFTSLFLLNFAW